MDRLEIKERNGWSESAGQTLFHTRKVKRNTRSIPGVSYEKNHARVVRRIEAFRPPRLASIEGPDGAICRHSSRRCFVEERDDDARARGRRTTRPRFLGQALVGRDQRGADLVVARCSDARA